MEDALKLLNFIDENKKTGGLTLEISEEIRKLVEKRREPILTSDCSYIEAELGLLGSLVIRNVVSCEPQDISYTVGKYDYVNTREKTRWLLWTDYSKEQPFNRMSNLYCGGASFELLGEPTYQCEQYREFDVTLSYESNLSSAIWGWYYNDFYKTVRFGIVLKKNKLEEFITELRVLIGKDHLKA